MKKFLLIALALCMVLSVAACAAVVTLVDVKTAQGISLKLPSDLVAKDNTTYANAKTGDSASFGATADATAITSYTQDDLLASNFSNYADAKILSFENDKQIDGKDSIVCKYTFTSQGGNGVAGTLIYLSDGTNVYVINFSYSADNANGSMAKNLQACIDSITVAAN